MEIMDDLLDLRDWLEDSLGREKRKAKSALRGESGFSTLVTVLVIMVVGAIIITPLLAFVVTGTRAGETHDRNTDRFYAADAGIQDGLWRVSSGDYPDGWKGTWDDTVYDDDPLTYSVPGLNGCDVTVTLRPVWLLAGLETEAHGRTPHAELVTVSNAASAGELQIVVVMDESIQSSKKIERIGIWIPEGFEYVEGSSSLEDIDPTEDAYCVPTVSDWKNGQTIIFDYDTAVKFEDFPDVDGERLVISLEYTGAGAMTSSWSWTRTNSHDIYLSWSTAIKIFQVESTATDPDTGATTTVVAGNMINESVGTYLAYYGDYEVTGNALMRETGTDKIRDHLYVESPGEISVIPESATVRKILLYWSGWKEQPDDIWDYTTEEKQELAEDASVTQVSLRAEYDGDSYDLGIITAEEWTVLPNGSEGDPNGWSYGCNCDITNLVVGDLPDDFAGNATYWVGHAEVSEAVPTVRGVWGSSSSNVFIVGAEGYITHYDGTSWSTMTSGTTNTLYGVWGSSASNVFAVGADGTILRYNGTSWSSMTSGTTNTLYGVWGSSASNVYAVGASGTIRKYNGTSWASSSSGTTNTLYGIWGTASNNIYAVGASGTIRKYTTSWASSSSGTTNTLYGIWGTASNNIYAVGASGTIRKYTSSWAGSSSGTTNTLYGIWGSASNNIYAVGASGTIRRYTSSWGNSSSGTTSTLYGVWGSSSSNIYAAGADGTIRRYTTSWGAVNSGTALYTWVNGHSGETANITTQNPLSDVVSNQWANACWSIITLYTSPVTLAHQMYLFDTFRYWNSEDDISFTLDGFLAPQGIGSEDDAVRLTYFVGEGDQWYSNGDNIYLNGTQLNPGYSVDADAAPDDNAMNSASVSGGVTGYPPDDGIDLDTYSIDGADGIIDPADSEATVRLTTGTDIWNLAYMILSFRSDNVGGGCLTYVVI